MAKLTYLVAIIGGHVTAQLPTSVRFMTKQNSIWSKALIMPLTIWNCVFLIKRKIISVKIGLFFQEITFRTEFPGSNFLLHRFLTGGKCDFQVAILLLATNNFEPYSLHITISLIEISGSLFQSFRTPAKTLQ